MLELYRLRDVALYQDGRQFVVKVNEKEKFRADNPVQAWTFFIDDIDCIVRRRIGKWNEKHGRNKFTGEGKER